MTSRANSLLSRVNLILTSHKQVLTAAVRMAMITRPKKSSKKHADQSESEPDQYSFEPARSGGSRRKSLTSSSLRSALEKVKDAGVAEILDHVSSDGFIDDDITHTSTPVLGINSLITKLSFSSTS